MLVAGYSKNIDMVKSVSFSFSVHIIARVEKSSLLQVFRFHNDIMKLAASKRHDWSTVYVAPSATRVKEDGKDKKSNKS